MGSMRLDDALIRRLPKVLLHEHLDGGLRPQTVIDLAAECRYPGLPTTNAAELGEWFHRGANKGSLPEYLDGFVHTCAVMQTRAAIERVAFEFIEDMHFDGVVYAEVRFAPCFHMARGLTPEAVERQLSAGSRALHGRAAPAKGLTLERVVYSNRQRDGGSGPRSATNGI